MVMESEPQPGNGHEPHNTTSQQQKLQCDDQTPSSADEAELLWNLRKYLILLATLSATITYQAGLAQPGCLWPDNQQGYLASDVVMFLSRTKRYRMFFYCNTTAFITSLIVLILLLVRELRRNAIWLRSLQFALLLDLLGLVGAYAAGNRREVRTSIYIWVLLVGIFTYVGLHVVFFRHLAPEWLGEVFRDIQRFWEDSAAHIFNRRRNIKHELDAPIQDEKEALEQNRGFLLVAATLAAIKTYTAGLSPPGGRSYWDDNKDSHIAGDLVLRDQYPLGFNAFMFFDKTAFSGSFVIIIMLLSKTGVNYIAMSNVLRLWILISLMATYAVGSRRKIHTSIYVFSLFGAVLLYLIIQWVACIMPKPEFIRKCIKWMEGEQKKLVLKLNSFMDSCSRSNGRVPRLQYDGQHSCRNGASSTVNNVKDDLGKLQTYLLWFAILAATITYQAGLHPPGGFWPRSRDPILEAINPIRYKAFYYCNTTAFLSSLVIIMLLQSQLITIGAMK
ncbi:uncharacterized protein LOC125525824 [Triticum urartu]|uniref:uncharacterized protein LOC125525824 n=1 Tax=Triticum urartu TaxID=4572 RepID=UPI0020434964|nr:uncharacterized protein LOC125525824 [Triticum urartu]